MADAFEPMPLPSPIGGVVLDRPVDQLEDHQLASAMNMVVREGVVQQRFGYQTVLGSGMSGDTPQQLYEWIPFNQSAFLMIGGTGFVRYYDTTADTWVTVNSSARNGTTLNPVSFVPMRTASAGLRLITLNGVDPPLWWSGNTASTFVNLTTAVIGTCGDVWRSHFVQGDVTTSADGRVAARVQWSAIGDPTTWSGTASVGTLDLLDANGTRVMAFKPMRGTELVYKEEGVHALNYKGSPFYFVQTLVHAHLTLLCQRGVIPIFNGDQHVVITKENIIMWDGQNIDRIGDPIRKHLYGRLNWDATEAAWGAYSPLTEEVVIGWPTSHSYADEIWIFNLRHGSWWPTDLASFTHATTVNNIFNPPKFVACNLGSQRAYELFSGQGDTTSGTTISSSLQWKLFDFGRSGYQKRVHKVTAVVDPGTGTTTTVTLQRAMAEQPLVSLTFDTGSTITSTGGNKELVADAKLMAKWASFRLTHSGASEPLRVRGLVPWIEPEMKERKTRE